MAKKLTRRKDVGKGIRALLSNIEQEVEENTSEEVVKTLASNVAHVKIADIEVNPFQPRVDFDQEALEELSESIKVHGLIQPITVRRLEKDKYQLISGERRTRASKLAGLEEIPAYIRLANDQEMLEMALIENIQRENLNAIEVAHTYQRLIDECELTHEQLSERMGKKRASITNYLRLLKLPPEIKAAVKNKQITFGHARSLVGVSDIALQLSLFAKVLNERISVRALDRLIASYNAPKKKPQSKELPHEVKVVQDKLSKHFSAKVNLKRQNNGRGQIVINFVSDGDLNRLLDIIDGES